MKPLHHILGILCAFALMITGLITSVEAVTYWTPGFYEKEYTKYGVADDVKMEMDDLIEVTEEMMAYLRGKRPDLHVPTTVDGQQREFFNDREIAHMEDVRGLFLDALTLRKVCLGLMACSVLILLLLKADLKRLLPKTILAGSLSFFLILGGLGLIISMDFSKYFIIFHEIFFSNDLWILNPATDLLINIVPEPFFMDTALRIILTFSGFVAAVFAICALFLIRNKRPRK